MGGAPGSTIYDAALAYAARGWPVFPCHARTKQPLTTRGFKDASTDPEKIRQWWTRWPKAMIGVPTGSPIGAFVLDIDAGTDADTGEVFELDQLRSDLEKSLGVALPETCVAVTPRGGRHLYFLLGDGHTIRNRTGLLPRIDVRGEGGYVILAPSLRADGKAYTWQNAPDQIAPGTAPQALIDLILRDERSKQQPP